MPDFVWGYARVSSDGQAVEAQIARLMEYGCDQIVHETIGGAKAKRPALKWLLDRLRPGDEVAVLRVDRLARSLLDLLGIVRKIRAAGATLRSLTEPIGGDSASNDLMLNLLGAFAAYELRVIQERTREGLAAAKERGVELGRPSKVTAEFVAYVGQAKRGGMLDTKAQRLQFARRNRVSESTLWRAMRAATLAGILAPPDPADDRPGRAPRRSAAGQKT